MEGWWGGGCEGGVEGEGGEGGEVGVVVEGGAMVGWVVMVRELLRRLSQPPPAGGRSLVTEATDGWPLPLGELV